MSVAGSLGYGKRHVKAPNEAHELFRLRTVWYRSAPISSIKKSLQTTADFGEGEGLR